MGKSEFPCPNLNLRHQLETAVLSTVNHHPAIVGSTPSPLRQDAQLAWPDEAATQAFAETLAAEPAVRNAFIALQGTLGAGKTTLVRHLLRALGVAGRIKSPTYAVVEPHELPGLFIWHFDFYRFSDPREWEDAGFRDIFASPGLKLAEWPDQAGAMLPTPDLAIAIEPTGETSRAVTLTAGSDAGVALLRAATAGRPA